MSNEFSIYNRVSGKDVDGIEVAGMITSFTSRGKMVVQADNGEEYLCDPSDMQITHYMTWQPAASAIDPKLDFQMDMFVHTKKLRRYAVVLQVFDTQMLVRFLTNIGFGKMELVYKADMAIANASFFFPIQPEPEPAALEFTPGMVVSNIYCDFDAVVQQVRDTTLEVRMLDGAYKGLLATWFKHETMAASKAAK